MGLRGYYLADPGTLVTFPVAERYGSTPIARSEADIVYETNKGKRWVYKQFTRRVWKLVFRMTAQELGFFLDLHEAVEGQAQTFYFVEDVDTFDSVDDAFLVRKEPDFMPVELPDPAIVNGVQTAIYDYTLELTTEPTDAEVGE